MNTDARSLNFDLCRQIIGAHKYPLVFATVSGAHLYGFPSPDSDYDLRGVHQLPLPVVLGLGVPHETVESVGFVSVVVFVLVTVVFG
mgnify:CR=1 FL=1